jgi:Mn2+/Fe2+ NRAMP family transporter
LAGSASYAISESFAWDTGLYRKLKEAYAFYGVIIIAMLVGLALNFIGLDPIKALLYSAVANGVVAPIVLYFIVRISSNGEVMGNYANGPVKRTIGWLTILLMAVAGIAALLTIFA